jgi:hypothetical protein
MANVLTACKRSLGLLAVTSGFLVGPSAFAGFGDTAVFLTNELTITSGMSARLKRAMQVSGDAVVTDGRFISVSDGLSTISCSLTAPVCTLASPLVEHVMAMDTGAVQIVFSDDPSGRRTMASILYDLSRIMTASNASRIDVCGDVSKPASQMPCNETTLFTSVFTVQGRSLHQVALNVFPLKTPYSAVYGKVSEVSDVVTGNGDTTIQIRSENKDVLVHIVGTPGNLAYPSTEYENCGNEDFSVGDTVLVISKKSSRTDSVVARKIVCEAKKEIILDVTVSEDVIAATGNGGFTMLATANGSSYRIRVIGSLGDIENPSTTMMGCSGAIGLKGQKLTVVGVLNSSTDITARSLTCK